MKSFLQCLTILQIDNKDCNVLIYCSQHIQQADLSLNIVKVLLSFTAFISSLHQIMDHH